MQAVCQFRGHGLGGGLQWLMADRRLAQVSEIPTCVFSTPFALSEVEVRVVERSACILSFDFAEDER